MKRSFLLSLVITATLLLSGCGSSSNSNDESKPIINDDKSQISISQVNQTPVATFESFTIQKGSRYDGELKATDPDGDELKYEIVDKPQHGTVVLHDNGCFTYTPDDGYQGSDTFSYRASDDLSSCAVKTVTVDVCKPTIQVPQAPKNLTVDALSTTSIRLSWDVSSNSKEYTIYKDGKLVATTDGDTFKIICGLKPDTTYNFEVRAKNQAGTSEASKTTGKTKDVTTPPNAPTELKSTAVEKTSVRLTWKDNANNESSYEIYQDEKLIKTISAGCACTVVSGLSEGTTYTFIVKAVNKLGSGDSESLSVKTKGGSSSVATTTTVTKTYTYDLAGRVIKEDFNNGSYIEYTYDDNGNLINQNVVGGK